MSSSGIYPKEDKVEGDLEGNSGAGNVIILGMNTRCSQSHQNTEQGERMILQNAAETHDSCQALEWGVYGGCGILLKNKTLVYVCSVHSFA